MLRPLAELFQYFWFSLDAISGRHDDRNHVCMLQNQCNGTIDQQHEILQNVYLNFLQTNSSELW